MSLTKRCPSLLVNDMFEPFILHHDCHFFVTAVPNFLNCDIKFKIKMRFTNSMRPNNEYVVFCIAVNRVYVKKDSQMITFFFYLCFAQCCWRQSAVTLQLNDTALCSNVSRSACVIPVIPALHPPPPGNKTKVTASQTHLNLPRSHLLGECGLWA